MSLLYKYAWYHPPLTPHDAKHWVSDWTETLKSPKHRTRKVKTVWASQKQEEGSPSNSLSRRSVFLSQMGHGTWVAWPGLKHQETEWTLTIKLTTLKSLLKIQPVSWTVVTSCRRGNGLLVAKGMFFRQMHFHSVPWLNMQTSWWVSTQHHKTLKPASTSSD